RTQAAADALRASPDSELAAIFATQLHLMERQLELLAHTRGQDRDRAAAPSVLAPAPAGAPPAPAGPAAPAPQAGAAIAFTPSQPINRTAAGELSGRQRAHLD